MQPSIRPSVPHRVVGVRDSFSAREASHVGQSLAIGLIVAVFVQVLILFGHWVYLGERAVLSWFGL